MAGASVCPVLLNLLEYQIHLHVQHPRIFISLSRLPRDLLGHVPRLPHGIYRVASLLTPKNSINEAFDLKGDGCLL